MELASGNINERLGTTAFLSGALLYLFLTVFLLPATPIFFENDHFIQMYDSVRMLGGEVMYRDFFQFTFPGTQVWYLVLFRALGQRIWILNATIVFLGFSLTCSILAISRRLVTGVYVYVAPAIFLFFGFRWYGMDGGHRLFSCLFSTLAILAILDKISAKRLLAAGFFCALATFFTQNRGVGIFAAICLFLIWNFFPLKQGIRLREFASPVLLFGSAFGLSMLALIGYFLVTAGTGTFLESTIIFAQSYNADPVNNSNLYLQFWQNLFSTSNIRSSLPVDLFYYLLVPAIYIVPPIYYFIRKPLDDEVWRKIILLCVSGILLFLVTTGLNGVRLYHVSIPGLVLLSFWWSNLSRRRLPLAGVAAIVFISAVLCIWGQLRPYPPMMELPVGSVVFTSAAAGEKYNWIKDHTMPRDLVFEPYRTVVNFPLMVRNPTSFATLRNNDYTSAAQVEKVVSELTGNPPKYILWNGVWSAPDPEREPNDHLGPLYGYLTSNYQLRQKLTPVFEIDIEVWERKSVTVPD